MIKSNQIIYDFYIGCQTATWHKINRLEVKHAILDIKNAICKGKNNYRLLCNVNKRL